MKKNTAVKVFFALFFVFSSSFFYAEDASWNFSLVTDFAYYPKTEYKSGSDHFSPVTGGFSGVELRSTFYADYFLPCPINEDFLFKDGNLVFGGALELSPISVRALSSITYTPLPFLQYSAGFSFGTGWNLLSFNGLKELDKENSSAENAEYKDLDALKNYYYDFWAKALFQFDSGAIFQGDWTHILMVLSYQVIYKGLTGTQSDSIWAWQNSVNQANGFQYAGSVLLGYQMPLILHRIGVMWDMYGHFTEDYGKFSDDFDALFMRTDISPFVQLDFGKKDSLFVIAAFSSRRSFYQEHTDAKVEPYLKHAGTEWFFYRAILRWTHKF